ncbi:Transcriptional activator protein CopR [Gallionellaceae bacterium]|nr:Transcriptional activator protein CopR [Gallionellaceae bacterium]
MKFLIVEDNKLAAELLKESLATFGYESDIAYDGEQGLEMAHSHSYGLWVIDIMLPKINGLELLKSLRSEGAETPALFLSARGRTDDRVQGLQAGGDDYIVKPYALPELQARIEALLRRTRNVQATPQAELEVDGLRLDPVKRSVIRDGQIIPLHPVEFRLLEYFMRHPGQVITRSMLLENVWNMYFDPQTKLVEVHISRLRTKIDKPFPNSLLHTIRGTGYIFRPHE